MNLKKFYKTCLPLTLVLAACLSSCGRKQKNILSFPDKTLPKINKLTLPTVHGVTVQKTRGGNQITWLEPKVPTQHVKIAGYKIFRLTRGHFAAKKTLNKNITLETTFIDPKPSSYYKNYYYISAVFTIGEQAVDGPISQIVCE